MMEPYGKGNEEPIFLVKDIIIEKIKTIKERHILIFFQNDNGLCLKGIMFNVKNTELFDYLLKYKQFKFEFLCTVKRDNFSNNDTPQIHISDARVIN